MCGRFVQLNATIERSNAIRNFIKNTDTYSPHLRNLESYNVAPGRSVVAVHNEISQPQLDIMTWGYMPKWAKDGRRAIINARAETVLDKPSFKSILGTRAIVPVEGFYEWKRGSTHTGKSQKLPYYFRRTDSEIMLLAALYAKSVDPDTGEIRRTFLLLTRSANQMMANYHDRMPVILGSDQISDWLENNSQAEAVTNATEPAPDDLLSAYRVSTSVNSYKNDGPELIKIFNNEANEVNLF